MSNKKKKKNVAKNNEASKKVEEAKVEVKLEAANEKATVKTNDNYQESQDVQLTVYTVVTAFSLLIVAFAGLAGGGAIVKPIYFIAEAILGNDDYDFTVFGETIYGDSIGKFKTIFIVSFVLIVVALIMSFYTVIKAMKPENKPNVLVSVLTFVVAAAAAGLAIYFFAAGYGNAKPYFARIEHHFRMNWILAYIILVAVNAIGALVSVFASLAAYSKWEQEGKAY